MGREERELFEYKKQKLEASRCLPNEFIKDLEKINKHIPWTEYTIQEILEKGINVMIEFDPASEKNHYIIRGFYKSDYITLSEDEDGILIAEARYDERTRIDCFDDLVHLNNAWWLSSRYRFEGWEQPDPQWLPFLLEKGLIKEEVGESRLA